jgi:hypothetical protein
MRGQRALIWHLGCQFSDNLCPNFIGKYFKSNTGGTSKNSAVFATGSKEGDYFIIIILIKRACTFY